MIGLKADYSLYTLFYGDKKGQYLKTRPISSAVVVVHMQSILTLKRNGTFFSIFYIIISLESSVDLVQLASADLDLH